MLLCFRKGVPCILKPTCDHFEESRNVRMVTCDNDSKCNATAYLKAPQTHHSGLGDAHGCSSGWRRLSCWARIRFGSPGHRCRTPRAWGRSHNSEDTCTWRTDRLMTGCRCCQSYRSPHCTGPSGLKHKRKWQHKIWCHNSVLLCGCLLVKRVHHP